MSDLKTITVADLIARLEDEDPNALVIFSADYGDRGNTEQALPIRGNIETITITKSAYSASGFAIGEPDDDEDEDDYEPYLVIR